jgi:putative transcriptional regulator
MVRKSQADVRKAARVDRKKVRRTSERDIARQIAEDPDTAPDLSRLPSSAFRRVVPAGKMDVRAIRLRTGLSQSDFARRYGFSKRTLQEWEQLRREPTGAARVLLTIIGRIPKQVERALTDEEAA